MDAVHLVLRNSHIAAGLLALVSGAAAMTFAKGSSLHRRAGNAFFVSMLVLALFGIVLSIIKTVNMGNVMGGTTAFYMVVTAWLAAVRPAGRSGAPELVAAGLGTVATLGATTFAVLATLNGSFAGYLPIMYYVFAAVLGLSTVADYRMVARGGVSGTARTTRHLWRMCLAFFMATGSFFFGQPKFVPAFLKETRHFIVAGLLPLILMVYWLIRVRVWPSLRKFRPPQTQAT